MRSTGISPTKNINFIGHSLGSYVSWEAAKALNGVDRIVALDPANSLGAAGSYDVKSVKFSDYTNYSWAFKSSPLGDSEKANTADESFEITYVGFYGLPSVLYPQDQHNYVIGFFASLIRRNREGTGGKVSHELDLANMNFNASHPWKRVSGFEGTIDIVKEGNYKWIPKDVKYGDGGFLGFFQPEIYE